MSLYQAGSVPRPSERALIALSIRQPWVELILRGQKTIEVRSWSTRHRGTLLLHAGAQPDRDAMNTLVDDDPDAFVYGAVLGSCELHDCIRFDEQTWERWRARHLNPRPFVAPRFGWMLRDPVRISPPRPLKGRLGLMRIDGSGWQL